MSTSIFDLKLKTSKRVVKFKKIERILSTLFNPEDNTKRLQGQISQAYSDSYGSFYTKLINDDLSFLQDATSLNLKKGLDPINKLEDKRLLIRTLSLYPGDILPNDEELFFISSAISARIKGSVPRLQDEIKAKYNLQSNKKEHIIKFLVIYLFESVEGRFPNKEDFLSVINEISNEWKIDLDKYSFSLGDLSVIKGPEVTEADLVKELDKSLQEMANTGATTLYSSILYKLDLFPELKHSFFENIKQSNQVSIVKQSSSLRLLMKSLDPSGSKRRLEFYLDEIFTGNEFSAEFKTIIKEIKSGIEVEYLYFSLDSLLGKLLFSNNYRKEFLKFISIAKEKYDAKVIKCAGGLGSERLCVLFGLEYEVNPISAEDLKLVLS